MSSIISPMLPFTRGNPKTARVVFIGEAPGKEEEFAFQRGQKDTAFIGKSGNLLNSIITASGINLDECYFTNVVKQRPPGNEIKTFKKDVVEEWTSLLLKELAGLKHANILVPCGNIALGAITNIKTIKWNNDGVMKTASGIGNWRGSIIKAIKPIDHLKVMPTYHPAFILRNWSSLAIVKADMSKIALDRFDRNLYIDNQIIHINPTFDEAHAFIKRAMNAKYISTDIENKKRYITCIGIGISEEEAMCIPLCLPDTGEPYWTREEEAQILLLLHKLLTQHDKQIGQFYFHDAYYYHHMGLIEAQKRLFKNCFLDCFTAHSCLAGEFPHNLGFLTSLYTRIPYYKEEGRQWRKEHGIDKFWTYNARDCITTVKCGLALMEELKDEGLWDFYNKFYVDLFPYILQTGIRGIHVNEDVRLEARRKYKQIWIDMQMELQQKVGRQLKDTFHVQLHMSESEGEWKKKDGYFNVNSYKHILSFVESLDLSKPLVSTGEKQLKKLKAREPRLGPIVDSILSIRHIRKIKSTYLDPKLGPFPRRFNFLLKTSTETGRLASEKDPMGFGGNSQNIPDGICRRYLEADKGKVLISADYEQAEARMVAYLCGSEDMISAYEKGDREIICECGSGKPYKYCCGDAHRISASKIYGISPAEINDKQRFMGKKIRHAVNYMMGPITFSEQTGLSVGLCKALIFNMHQESPEIKMWHRRTEREIRINRKLVNPFGRVRRFYGRINDRKTLREAIAFIPQSTIPDLVNTAYKKIAKANIQIINQVHDELVAQAWINEVDEACEFIQEAMRIEFIVNNRKVTIPSSIKIGPNWDKRYLKEWKPKVAA
ncbi:MAG: DNA polymerase [Candidatus Scalindua sp.]